MSVKRSYPPPALSKKNMGDTRATRDSSISDDRKALGVIHTDEDGDYLLTTAGRRVAVIYRNDAAESEHSGHSIVKRQSDTFAPPSDYFLDSGTCQSLASSGTLKAICVDCVQGLGNGVKASNSAEIDCRNAGSPCVVTFTQSVTVTDTFSIDITFGGTIGDTGESGANGMATFGFGESVSIATSTATAEALSIPVGKVGYVQFQPQALLGTVVTTTASGPVCDSLGLNKICGAAPGIVNSSDKDSDGKYSVVLTN